MFLCRGIRTWRSDDNGGWKILLIWSLLYLWTCNLLKREWLCPVYACSGPGRGYCHCCYVEIEIGNCIVGFSLPPLAGCACYRNRSLSYIQLLNQNFFVVVFVVGCFDFYMPMLVWFGELPYNYPHQRAIKVSVVVQEKLSCSIDLAVVAEIGKKSSHSTIDWPDLTCSEDCSHNYSDWAMASLSLLPHVVVWDCWSLNSLVL